MGMLYKPRGRMLLLVVLSLCWAGCTRPAGSNEPGAQAGQQVPFRGGTEAAATPSDSTLAVPEQTSGGSTPVPFRDPQSLPVGTLLTVRLKDPISSGLLGGTFAAVVDDAVVVDGSTLVPSGVHVFGHVESTGPAPEKHNRGLVRLTLTSIDIGGLDLPLQTSSLFARGATGETAEQRSSHLSGVRLEPGRRLTFRLTESVPIAGQIAKSTR